MARGYPDFEGQKSGVWGMAEWSSHEGQQKRFFAGGTSVAIGDNKSVSYTVPTGKSLYITALSGQSSASDDANAEFNQVAGGFLVKGLATVLIAIGGNGGFGVTFPTPVIFVAAESMRAEIVNGSNHLCDLYISAIGWEV